MEIVQVIHYLGEPIKISFAKVGILSQQGVGGCDQILTFFVKLAKTKFAFVNGQKCDETHNT